jgi:hypothetical protein
MFKFARNTIEEHKALQTTQISLNKSVPTYIQALSHKQRDLIIQREQYMANLYNVRTLKHDLIEALQFENMNENIRFANV